MNFVECNAVYSPYTVLRQQNAKSTNEGIHFSVCVCVGGGKGVRGETKWSVHNILMEIITCAKGYEYLFSMSHRRGSKNYCKTKITTLSLKPTLRKCLSLLSTLVIIFKAVNLN